MESLLYLGGFFVIVAPIVAVYLAARKGLREYPQTLHEDIREHQQTPAKYLIQLLHDHATELEIAAEEIGINRHLSLAELVRTGYEIGKGGIETRLAMNGNLDAALRDYGGRKTEAVDKLMGIRDELEQHQIQHEQTKPPKESALYEIDKIIATINSDVLKTPEQI